MFVPADLVRALAVVVAHPFTTLWILLLAFLVRKGTTLAHTSNDMPQHCLVALRVCTHSSFETILYGQVAALRWGTPPLAPWDPTFSPWDPTFSPMGPQLSCMR